MFEKEASFYFLRCIYSFEGTVTEMERQRQREGSLPSIGSLPKRPQQTEARSQDFIWVLHVGAGDQVLGPPFAAFLGH